MVEINTYTADRFGPSHARRLRQALRQTVEMLAAHPMIANRRIDPPHREFRFCSVLRRFVGVYVSAADGICIVRILNGARHLADEFRDGEDEQQT